MFHHPDAGDELVFCVHLCHKVGRESQDNLADNEVMELGKVMQALYDSQINCEVFTFWDNGFSVRLGDFMKGFDAETLVDTSGEAAIWLDKMARETYPTSSYAQNGKISK